MIILFHVGLMLDNVISLKYPVSTLLDIFSTLFPTFFPLF